MESKRYRRLAVFAAGAALALIGGCIALGRAGAMAYLCGAAGVVLLTGTLVLVQLSFWHEGDRKQAAARNRRAQAGTERRPRETTEGAREGGTAAWHLMSRKLERAEEEARRREKQRLGLCEEEDILFMERRRSAWVWPVGAIAGLSLLASAFAPAGGPEGFFFLAAGLVGLGLLSAMKGRVQVYLTSFRILLSEEPFGRGGVRWTALPYKDVNDCRLHRGRRQELAVRAGDRRIEISGLPPRRMEGLVSLLQEKLRGEAGDAVKPLTPL